MTRGDILVFMTQDAVLTDSRAIERLIAPFAIDPRIVAVYGRQLPKADATIFGEHLRSFNYPDTSEVRCFEDRHKYGFKTAFISNSFAAYRKLPLEGIGYFEEGLLFGEDAYTVTKLLSKGFCVAYAADACVFHSHNYSILQDFKRYFDIGVFHARHQTLIEKFGTPIAEGRRYVQSEFSLLIKRKKYWLLPESCVRNLAKFLAYNLGKRYSLIPFRLSMRLSMNRKWWMNSAR
jgi:rhamnosyltransferase